MAANGDVKPMNRILKKRTVNGESQYLVQWTNGRQQWVPQPNLRCPNLLERFETYSRQKDIINRYNATMAVNKSEKYGFERNQPVEKFVGAMLLEGIPVLEAQLKNVDEHDFVLWEEAEDRYPQKVLDFYLNLFLFKQKSVVCSWGGSDLPPLPK